MTKHRRRKQDARKRMAATGTSYIQAQREGAQERSKVSAISNPILREWGLTIQAGHLTVEELLEGWTLDGPGASPRAKGETYLEMKMLEFLWPSSSMLEAALSLPLTWREELLTSWRRGESYEPLKGHFYPGPMALALYAPGSAARRETTFFSAVTRITSERIPLFAPAIFPDTWVDFEEQLRITLALGLVSPKVARKVRRIRDFLAGAADELTVWELGEGGSSWFMEGAEDEQEAAALLQAWLVATERSTIKDPFTGFLSHALTGITFTGGSDWFWKPLDANALDAEAELISFSKTPARHSGETFVRGFLAQD